MAELAPGRLLVASPTLADSNFMHSVVFLLEHGDGGSLGLIINRPLPMPLEQLWEDCPEALAKEQRGAEGGPVERHRGLLLHAFTDIPDTYVMPCGVCVGADSRTLAQRFSSSNTQQGPRLFLGHSGWSPGQLDSEIDQESWLVRSGNPAILLDHQGHDELWQSLIDEGPEIPDFSYN